MQVYELQLDHYMLGLREWWWTKRVYPRLRERST